MKTDINGVSQCPKGTEHYETFTAMGRGQRGTVFFQYDYRAEDGTLFSCVKPSLGHSGEFYGIFDPAVGKCGIKFL